VIDAEHDVSLETGEHTRKKRGGGEHVKSRWVVQGKGDGAWASQLDRPGETDRGGAIVIAAAVSLFLSLPVSLSVSHPSPAFSLSLFVGEVIITMGRTDLT
jgi:hypothetical protein